MTPEEIVVAALGIVSDYTDAYPTTRSIMYRRISARQRELFVHIGGLDPEFYGADIVAPLEAGAINLAALEESGDIYPIETIQQVRVQTLTDSPPDPAVRFVGERVNVIDTGDEGAHLAPRATLRSGVLRGWTDDLDDVESLWIAYSRRPRPILPDGSGEIELLEPFQDLLIFDLTRDLVRRTVGLEGEAKAAVVAMVESQESQLMESLASHIASAAGVRQSRF